MDQVKVIKSCKQWPDNIQERLNLQEELERKNNILYIDEVEKTFKQSVLGVRKIFTLKSLMIHCVLIVFNCSIDAKRFIGYSRFPLTERCADRILQ